MNDFWSRLSKNIDQLNDWIGRSVSWLCAAMILVTIFDVAMRYLLNQSQVWAMELEWHLFALLFLFGMGYGLRHDRHVRVDLFYNTFSRSNKGQVNFWGTLLLLLPWCLLVIWTSFPVAVDSMLKLEGSSNPYGLPFRFIIRFALVFGFLLLFLQGISQLIKARQDIRSSKD